MSSDRAGEGPPSARRRRAGRTGRRLAAVVVILVLVLGGYGAYAYWVALPPPGSTVLVVDTYASLFGGNCTISPALASALAPFESAHRVTIRLNCPPDLLTALASPTTGSSADVVVGLDEVTAPEALAKGLIVPYVSPQLAHVAPALANELDAGHGVTPYEWGYLAIDYTAAFGNATGGAIARASFANFTSNNTWRNGLLLEDPASDIVGEEFLLWEIEFYTAVLHQDWTTWWKDGGAKVATAPDWGTAFGEFSSEPTVYPTVVSYTTDSAYAAANGAAGSLNTSVTTWNGTEYGWRTVYGAAIAQGSTHPALDELLIDWLLSGGVQAAVPLNEWEYPANATTALPTAFAAAIDPSGITPLDDATTPAAIAADLPTYLSEWQTIENQYG